MDPHHFDAEPDADLDSTYHPNADPYADTDSDLNFMRIRIFICGGCGPVSDLSP